MYSVIIALAIFGVTTAGSVKSPTNYSLTRLLARQGGAIDPSTIPPQCQSTCGPLVTDLQTCQTNACVCTAAVRGHFQDCMNCFISVSSGNPSIANAATSAATQYVSACKAAGQPVDPLSFTDVSGAPSTLAGGPSSAFGISSAGQLPSASISAPSLASASDEGSLTSLSASGGFSATATGGVVDRASITDTTDLASPTDAPLDGSGGGSVPVAGAAVVGASAHSSLTIGVMVLCAIAALW